MTLVLGIVIGAVTLMVWLALLFWSYYRNNKGEISCLT